jgi:putative membrane protein
METKNELDQQIRAKAEKDVDPRTDLAVERTLLALERTHLAWIRTMISLILAGFAIDKGFELLHKYRVETGEAISKNGHLAGMILTISGISLLLLETIFYIKRSTELSILRTGKRKSFLAPDFILAAVIICIGFLLIYFMSLTNG